ncbi:MAG: metallophosphoesterase, partial [Treponema sp.]|nr:metallophosphoesterase [Treponema sp.]
DIFDGDISTIKDLPGIAKELVRLSAPLGVYASQGNHDVDRRSGRDNSGTDRIKEFLESTGIKFLLDEVELIEGRFYLVGRRDGRPIGSSRRRLPAGELLEGLDKTKPLIIMDHQPADYLALEESGADLILSGHTHGGQIFPGSLITATMYRNYGAQHYGYFKGRTVQGIISSGAGVWGPAIRMGTNSEVAVINIEFVN